MAKNIDINKYDLVINPTGYTNKREVTNQDSRALVYGSKNVFINDGDKVATRKGYVLDGAVGTVNNGIDSNVDFISKTGKKVLRSFEGATANTGKLQVRTEYVTGTPVWYDLLTTLTYTEFSYAPYWNATESIRELVFVDGTNSIRKWSSAMAYVASNTATTITKSGTETWAQAGFYVSYASRSITIPGVGTYTYTGGEGTTTLTGLVGLPAITVGTPAFQGVVTITSLTGVTPTATPNVVYTKNNQVAYCDTRSCVIWGAKNTDYSDCSFTTPLRIPGEGYKITLDNYFVGAIEDSDSLYIFAGLDDLYKVNFTLSGDQATEAISFDKKRVGAGQAAISNKAIIPVKNGVMYFTNEKTLSWLTSVENIFTPQSLPISDVIKNDFDVYDLTGATGIFFENAAWLAIPMENLVYVYDFDKALWQAPFTLPISGFSIIKNNTTNRNELYGHSNSKNETYRLNTGLTDNGVAIDFIAAFAYRQFGDRSTLKQFDEYYNELYMSTVTNLTVTHNFEYAGSESIVEKNIVGTNTTIQFSINEDGNLGKNNLGKNPLGSTTNLVSDLNKYRAIHEMKMVDFFEHQVIFSSDSSNAQFEILAHGPNVRMSPNMPTWIKY